MPNPSLFVRVLVCATAVACGTSLLACSSSHKSNFPYDADKTNVIGGTDIGRGTSSGINNSDGGGFDNANGPVGVTPVSTVTTSTGEGCVEPDSVCEAAQDAAQKACGEDAATDVILGRHGQVLTTLCYPTDGWDVTVLGDDPVSTPPLDNNTVVVIDGKDDGVDITGDVNIKGNNVDHLGRRARRIRHRRRPAHRQEQRDRARRAHPGRRHDHQEQRRARRLRDRRRPDRDPEQHQRRLVRNLGQGHIEGNNAYFVSNLVAGDQQIPARTSSATTTTRSRTPMAITWSMREVLAPIRAARTTPPTRQSRSRRK